ncbi:hypothetical protein HHL21_16320 [Massilia sp. RP-1-19]|uniref:Uncharacterized protein n=1 Tax=Massilia polaris TaxID=2728846 RepID=A0A848HMY7_9BURK|nr:hypothetical protein [Massilia polaris]NML62612.1 hypothetical protein [Massilia polaris]
MSETVKRPGRRDVAAIAGSPAEVRSWLSGLDAEHVVAFALPYGAGRQAESIFETLSSLPPFMHEVLRKRHRQTREGAIFTIRHNGVDYYPSFGLDPGDGYRPLETLAAIMRVLGTTKDGWGWPTGSSP